MSGGAKKSSTPTLHVWDGVRFAFGMFVLFGMLQLGGMAIDAIVMVGRDDSDGYVRSGFRIRTDALTGCQYLETMFGDVTHRFDKSGKQVCR